jgi:hypothetical protein
MIRRINDAELRLPVLLLCVAFVFCSGFLGRKDVYVKDKDFAAAQSVTGRTMDSHWAVIVWILDEAKNPKTSLEEKAIAGQARKTCEGKIFNRWAETACQPFPFLRLNSATAVIEIDLAAVKAASVDDLTKAMAAMSVPVDVKPQKVQCLAFEWVQNLDRSAAFAAWVGKPHRLGGRYSAMQASLVEALDKLKFQKVKKNAEGLIGGQEYQAAFDYLGGHLGDFREANRKTLDTIRVTAAERDVAYVLQRLKTAPMKSAPEIAAVEKARDDAIERWKTQPIFAAALKQASQSVQEVNGVIGVARGLIVQTEISRLARDKYYWSAMHYCEKQLKAAQSLDPVVEKAVADMTLERYLQVLPLAVEHYVSTARQHVVDGDRHGIVLLLVPMLEQLASFPTGYGRKPSDEVSAQLDKGRSLQEDARRFAGHWLGRNCVVRPFGSTDQGVAFSQMLTAVLEKSLADSPMVFAVQVGDDKQRARRRDYVVENGAVGELSASGGEFTAQISASLSHEGEATKLDFDMLAKASGSDAAVKKQGRAAAIELLRLKVMRHAAAFPFELIGWAKDHADRGELDQAANMWGFVFAYCGNIEAQAPAGESGAGELKDELQQHVVMKDRLKTLKADSWANAASAMLKVMEPGAAGE